MNDGIRLATQTDRPDIEELVHAAYAHYVPRIGREPGPMLDDYAVLIEAARVHVLERQGVIQGVLVLIPEQNAMLLDNVAVASRARGSGVGRQLLEFAEQAAAEAGYRSIRLYTNEAMTENITLYTRIGYVETHRATEKGLRRVYMLKPITPTGGEVLLARPAIDESPTPPNSEARP